jgi:hypothetical protein
MTRTQILAKIAKSNNLGNVGVAMVKAAQK